MVPQCNDGSRQLVTHDDFRKPAFFHGRQLRGKHQWLRASSSSSSGSSDHCYTQAPLFPSQPTKKNSLPPALVAGGRDDAAGSAAIRKLSCRTGVTQHSNMLSSEVRDTGLTPTTRALSTRRPRPQHQIRVKGLEGLLCEKEKIYTKECRLQPLKTRASNSQSYSLSLENDDFTLGQDHFGSGKLLSHRSQPSRHSEAFTVRRVDKCDTVSKRRQREEKIEHTADTLTRNVTRHLNQALSVEQDDEKCVGIIYDRSTTTAWLGTQPGTISRPKHKRSGRRSANFQQPYREEQLIGDGSLVNGLCSRIPPCAAQLVRVKDDNERLKQKCLSHTLCSTVFLSDSANPKKTVLQMSSYKKTSKVQETTTQMPLHSTSFADTDALLVKLG